MDEQRGPDFVRSVEDDYVEYFEQSAGYAYDALDRLSPAQLLDHDRARYGDLETLGWMSERVDAYPGIVRWALALAWLERGDVARFVTLAGGVLKAADGEEVDGGGPLVVRVEVLTMLVLTLLRGGEPGAALASIAEVEELAVFRAKGVRAQLARLRSWCALVEGQEELARSHVSEFLAYLPGEDGDDSEDDGGVAGGLRAASYEAMRVELMVEAAKDALMWGNPRMAQALLDEAQAVALAKGFKAVLVDIALMRTTQP